MDMKTIMNEKAGSRLAVRLCCMALLALLGSVSALAQTAEDTVYVYRADQPVAKNFLPLPPDTLSTDFIDDMLQCQWGRAQRYTPRGRQASRESLWHPDAMRSVMAQVLQIDTISDEATPALSRLLVKTYNTARQGSSVSKRSYHRTRPFVMLNDALWAQYDDDNLRANSSYPSGHAAFGFAIALVYAEMWPELQDSILRRGYEFGENRVITGVHWQSDVTAGFLCAAATIARAHTCPELQKDILAARAEYAALKGLPAGYDPVKGADLPYGEKILNNPVDTASYRYMADVARHWAAKPLRNTERGDTAAREAEYSVEMMYSVFGEAMHQKLSPETTPAICRLIDYALEKASNCADRLKPLRFRKRPFVQLGEPSFVPGDEEKERGKSSFPSGHTNLGWTMALLMAEVAPDHQEEILRRGYQYGYNRLIVGYHWASDIEATRILSSALVARMHAGTYEQELIAKAREEYKQISTGITAPVSTAQAPARIYRLDGTPASDTDRGIVIENGQKVIRR